MKKFRLLSVVLVMFSVLGLTSCDTEPVDPVLNENGQNPGENPGGENPGGEEVFKVGYNGSTHTAMTVSGILANDQMQIVAVFGANGESMLLGLDGAPAVGTYDADELLMGYNMNAQDEDGFINMNGTESSGTLTISSIDTTHKTISGTFSFTAWSQSGGSAPIVFTNGVFNNIAYTGSTGGEVPVELDDIFKAKVNGTLHDYTNVDVSVIVSGEEGHKTIAIVGQDGGDTYMSLLIYSDYSTGTYSIATGFDDPSAHFNFLDETVDTVPVDNGTITVTSNANGRIKGTFTYQVKNDAGETIYTITDGQFDVEWDF